MKKNIWLFFAALLLTACQKQDITGITSLNSESILSGKSTDKIDVCHNAGENKWLMLNISSNSLAAHLAHGDILPDADQDGYAKNTPCGQGNDCNDNNAAINPGVVEICGNNTDDNCNGQVDENCFVIGTSYQGGKIAYLFKPGEPGYVPGETHGLIAAPSDQSTGAEWGCFETDITGADATALGTGYQNTIDIMAGCATEGIAARLCAQLVLNGYDDWYLPSKDELNKLFINKEAIGGFADRIYLSSSEYGGFNRLYAWIQFFSSDGIQMNAQKNNPYHVRAIRAF